jgi:hypothetical protein
VRTRSATEWRDFWRDGGERELASVLGDLSDHAPRVATLLGSRAPFEALVAELGRIRTNELGAAPDPEADRRCAEGVARWFDAA